MNLIYMCVFFQEKYIDLLKLLLESIKYNANINKENTHILIFTSDSFKKIIEKDIHIFDLPINFHIIELHTLMEASCCKLKIFDYPDLDRYDNLLYLDTDVLVNGDLNILFNTDISDDKLYALEEGNIGHEYWGGPLLFDFEKFDRNKSAFCAGVFYIRNSISMKTLFQDVNDHIKTNGHIPVCLDQPFLIYHCVKDNKYDNKMMKSYLENNPSTIDPKKLIYHFAGGPGHYQSKLQKMVIFSYNKYNHCTEFDTRNDMIKHYCSLIHNPKILEIGIFKGEFMNFIIENCKPFVFYGVDLFEGVTSSGDSDGNDVISYDVGKSFVELTEKYKEHDNIHLVKSDSSTFLKDISNNFFDIIYIDGDNSYEGVKKDLELAFYKIKCGGYIMGHDYEMNMNKAKTYYNFGVKQAVQEFCQNRKQIISAKGLDGCVSFCIKVIKK